MIKKGEWRNLLFWGFIIVYSVVLIFLAFKLNIWEDEAYSLHTTSSKLTTIISQAYDFEGQPPSYFLLLALWRKINSGIFFARLFSIIFIGLGAYFFDKLVQLVLGAKYSRWLLIIFLLNPFTVWAALEIRLYSFVIFLSTISIYFFFRFYLENKHKYLYLFLLISLIGLYTQYFFLLEIAALTAASLFLKGWGFFFKLCLYIIPLAVLFMPNLFFMHQQVAMLQSHKLEYTILNRIDDVLHSPQELLLLGLQNAPGSIVINRVAKVIFIMITIYAYYKAYKKKLLIDKSHFKKMNFIIISIFFLIAFYGILIAITGIIFRYKYMAVILPLLILIFTLFEANPFLNRNIIYFIISIYYVVSLMLIYRHPLKTYDFESIAKFISKTEHNMEPVLFYGKNLLPPFSYYYNQSNPLISLPAIKYDHNYYEENIYDTLELKKTIAKIHSPTNSYLLITGNFTPYKYTTNINQRMVDEFLNSNFKITVDTSFLGKTVDFPLRIRRLIIK